MALTQRQGPPTGPPPSIEYMAENDGPKLLAISCTLFGVAMVTVILRFYVRIFVLRMFGIDGWSSSSPHEQHYSNRSDGRLDDGGISGVCSSFHTDVIAVLAADLFYQLLSVACLGFFAKVISLGIGKHAAAVNPTNILPILSYMYFYSICIILAYSFIKLSIGFFLLRLADRTNWRKFLQGTLGQLPLAVPVVF
jgi:hypothetical protein